MFLKINGRLSQKHYWEANDNMDSRTYDPGWYYHKKHEGQKYGVLIRCSSNKIAGLFLYVNYATAIYIANQKIPPPNIQHVTINDMLETMQQNYWKFRYDCWSLAAKRPKTLDD